MNRTVGLQRPTAADEGDMLARIYQPTKNAMQSGKANTRVWLLEYEQEEQKTIDPLMGWTSSGDMRGQVRLKFSSEEEAIGYAKRNGIPYQLVEPKKASPKPKVYADNFAYTRVGRWTH